MTDKTSEKVFNSVQRKRIIARISSVGIVVNILIAGIKIILGILTSSIAIISEGVNNAADAVTSVLTLVGTWLAGKKPDEKHPFGYGRFEYLTGLVIALLILVSGIEMLINSFKLIFHPEELNVSFLALGIIAFSLVIKYILGIWTVQKGHQTASEALIGVGIECKNDCLVSLITILSAILFLVWGVSIDAYAGVLTSGFIIYSGLWVLRSTISEILGRPGEKELADKLYAEIRATPGILAAADLMLHNYGPHAYSGSVNVEIDHTKSVGEIYGFLHELQLRLMQSSHVTLVFGVYAVDHDHPQIGPLRHKIAQWVQRSPGVKGFHALYIQPNTNKIYCDVIVDYSVHDWEHVRENFLQALLPEYPHNEINLTIETEFVSSPVSTS